MNIYILISIALIFVLSFTGCINQSNYTRPEPNTFYDGYSYNISTFQDALKLKQFSKEEVLLISQEFCIQMYQENHMKSCQRQLIWPECKGYREDDSSASAYERCMKLNLKWTH